MAMKRQTVPIRSIERYRKNSQGGCDHIKNLKPQGDKWVPVNKKEVVAKLAHGDIYHHHVLPADEFLSYTKNHGITRLKMQPYPNSATWIATIAPPLGDVNISFIGNMMIVNTEDNVFYYLFKPNDDKYIQMPDIPLPHIWCEKETKVIDKVIKKDLSEPIPSDTMDRNDFVEGFKKAVAAIAAKINEITKAKDNYYQGAALITVAYELKDGYTILHNKPVSVDFEYDLGAYVPSVTLSARPIERAGMGYPLTHTPKISFISYVQTDVYPNVVYHIENVVLSRVTAKLFLNKNNLEALKQWRNIIRSISVYVHYTPSIYNLFSADPFSTNMILYKWSYSFMASNGIWMFFLNKLASTKTFHSQVTYRKLYEFPLQDILDKHEEQKGIFEYTVNLDGFNQKQPLGIDNNTHHKIISIKEPIVFNSALHYPGVITKFGKGNRVDAALWGRQYTTLFNNNLSPGNLHFINADGWVYIRTVVEIETDQGTIYVQNAYSPRKYRYRDTGIEFILLEAMLTYPDRRAVKMHILSEDHRLIKTFDLSEHETLNIAYFLFKEEDEYKAALSQLHFLRIDELEDEMPEDEVPEEEDDPEEEEEEEESDPQYIASFYCYDNNSNPLEGVAVSILDNSDIIGTTVSDSDGKASIPLSKGDYNVKLVRSGYYPKEFSFSIIDRDRHYDVGFDPDSAEEPLDPWEPGEHEVSFYVYTGRLSTGDPVPNAGISVRDYNTGEGVAAAKTDSAGKASVYLNNGRYMTEIFANNFSTRQLSFTIGDLPRHFDVSLNPK